MSQIGQTLRCIPDLHRLSAHCMSELHTYGEVEGSVMDLWPAGEISGDVCILDFRPCSCQTALLMHGSLLEEGLLCGSTNSASGSVNAFLWIRGPLGRSSEGKSGNELAGAGQEMSLSANKHPGLCGRSPPPTSTTVRVRRSEFSQPSRTRRDQRGSTTGQGGGKRTKDLTNWAHDADVLVTRPAGEAYRGKGPPPEL